MSLVPQASVPNPYKSQVFLRVGNDEVTVVPPEHLVSFNYEDNFGTSGDRFDIELFDKDAFILENKLHRNTQIDVQWGYVGHMGQARKTIMLSYEVTSVSPVAIGAGMQGVLLRIQGWDSSTDQGTAVQKTRSWDVGPLHKVVEAIANENGWKYKTGSSLHDPEVTIEECEDIPLADGRSNQFHQNDLTDLHFLRLFCIPGSTQPQAVSKHTGLADFKFGFDADRRFFFRPAPIFDPEGFFFRGQTAESSPRLRTVRRYTFPDPEGGVQAFTPEIRGPLVAKMGADTVIGRGRHGTTGEEIYVMRSSTRLKVYLVDPKKPDERVEVTNLLKGGLGKRLNSVKVNPAYTKDFGLSDPGGLTEFEGANHKNVQLSAATPEAAALEVHSWWMKYLAKFFRANLTVLGDPFLSPAFTDVIEVNFIVAGMLHYTSGLYLVLKALHNIDQNGKYTTALELQSAGIFRNQG